MNTEIDKDVPNIVILNPIAGKGRNIRYINRINKIFKNYEKTCTIYTTKYVGHATEIVRENVSVCKCRIYSLGGDGTLNEVVNGMANTDSELVVLPAGTGNDFVKTISEYKGIRKILIESFFNEATPSDLILINKTYCINIASFGFDSMVGKNVDIFRKVPLISGKAKYNLSIFYTLLTNINFSFKIRINSSVFKGKFTLAALANGKYYGGGVCPAPDADIHDGLFDMCLIDSTSVFEKIVLLPKYKKGEHLTLNKCKIIKANRLTIVSNKKFPANVDGQAFMTNKIRASICHNAINIVEIKKQER